MLSLRGWERIPGVPVASQEEALSTGKARGTPASCHHFQSPQDVSVHSRETCFPCTVSTFKPSIDIDTHNGGTWDSPLGKSREKASWKRLVGKPRGKAADTLIHAKGSVTLLLQLGRKAHVQAQIEMRTDSRGETEEVPQDPCQHCKGILRFRHRLHTRS